MRLSRIITIPIAIAMLSNVAYAQRGYNSNSRSDAAPAATSAPPWKQFYLNPKTRVELDFRNASVDAVLHTLSQASGIAIIKDPGLTGGITLQSPKPQTLGDAFAMLNAVLSLKNYQILKQNDFLEITPKAAAPSFGRFGTGGTNPFAGTDFGNRGSQDQSVLQVYPLKYANATALAKTINDVFALTPQTGQNPANPFTALAQQAAAAATPPANQGGRGGRGGRRGGGSDSGVGTAQVKVSADDYSNSLIVNAPSAQQDEIATIIDQIDRQTDTPQQSRVFQLQYAAASDVQPIIQNILSGTANIGRGGATQSGVTPPSNRGNFFQRLISSQSNNNTNNGTVSTDTRTNSLIVTATSEDLDHIAAVIQQLDKPATYMSTTFVYVMKNARADVVANLLNESFGNRTTNGPTGGSLTNPTFSSGTLTSGTSGSAATIGGANSTNSSSRQFQVTSQSQNQQTTPETTGLDENGKVVNIRNLTGQVILVPNIDTNSIIVVAPPEDKDLVTKILEQMDQAPEQVMIQTLVVEVSLTKADQLGVEYNFATKAPIGHGTGTGVQDFGLQNTIAGAGANSTTPEGLTYTLSAGQYSIFLQALQSDTNFNVLSTPRIFTTNNATAQINISQSLPYVTSSTVSTDGTSEIFNYNFLDVGIVLTVTPRILADGTVVMDVTQTANDFVNYTSFNAPVVNQRETQTTVNVADGRTVVLGGIISDQISDTVNKVPVLGDIPLIGNLFRSTSKTKDKTELLVFMTPHIIRDPDDADKLRLSTAKQLSPTAKMMVPQSVLEAVPPPLPPVDNSEPPAIESEQQEAAPSTVTPIVPENPAPAVAAPQTTAPALAAPANTGPQPGVSPTGTVITPQPAAPAPPVGQVQSATPPAPGAITVTVTPPAGGSVQ